MQMTMDPGRQNAMRGGFADAPREAAVAFRALLEAMARPGRPQPLRGATPPPGLSRAAGTALLVLADRTTPVHLAPAHDAQPLRDWITFHTGAPLVGPGEARFALGLWEELLPLERFSPGEADYPDRSATLIVERPLLIADGARLTGPGIETEAFLELPETAAFVANRARFPLGLDFLFTAGAQVAALPRTTHVEAR